MARSHKRDSIVSCRFDSASRAVITSVKGVGEIPLYLDRVTDQNRFQAEFHGWKRKLVDRAAIGFNKELGRYASPTEKYEAIKATADRLNAGGAWNDVAAPRAARKPSVRPAFVLQAMAQYYSKSIDQCKELVEMMMRKRGISEVDAYIAWSEVREIAINYAALVAMADAQGAPSAADMLTEFMRPVKDITPTVEMLTYEPSDDESEDDVIEG